MYLPKYELDELRTALKLTEKISPNKKMDPVEFYEINRLRNFIDKLISKYPSVGDRVDLEFYKLEERLTDFEDGFLHKINRVNDRLDDLK